MGESSREWKHAAGKSNRTLRDGRALGYGAEGGRVTGTAGLWGGRGPASVEQSSLGRDKPRLFVSRAIQTVPQIAESMVFLQPKQSRVC